MPDSVLIAAVFVLLAALAHAWTRRCIRDATLRAHRPDQRLNCTVWEYRRANRGMFPPAVPDGDGWENCGEDARYGSRWQRREVRGC